MGCECSVATNTHKSRKHRGRKKGRDEFDSLSTNVDTSKGKGKRKGAKKKQLSEAAERPFKSALKSPVPQQTTLEKEHPLGEGDVSISTSFKEPRKVSFHDEKRVTTTLSSGESCSVANPLRPEARTSKTTTNKETTSDTTGSSGRQLTSQLGIGDAEISGVASIVNSSQNSTVGSGNKKLVQVKSKRHGPTAIPKAKCGPSKVRVVRQWIDGSVLGDDTYVTLDGPLLDPQDVSAQLRREKKIEFREQAARTQQQAADQEELEKAKEMVASVKLLRAQKDSKTLVDTGSSGSGDDGERKGSRKEGEFVLLPTPTKLESLALSGRKSMSVAEAIQSKNRRSTTVMNFLQLPSEGATNNLLDDGVDKETEDDAASEQQTDMPIPPSLHEEMGNLQNIAAVPSSSEDMSGGKAGRSGDLVL